MIKKLRFLLLFPVIFSLMGCSSSDKIVFHSDDFEFETYYNDDYFSLDNSEVHEEIALASHAMALATFHGGEDYTIRSEYLEELWKQEKFSNIFICDAYKKEPGTDTIGYGIASKSIDDFTLIAIAVRGGNYDGEWASNVTIGLEGNARGFNEASDNVLAGFNNYLSIYNITGHIKVWISGYSRAAITSNMTAGKLLNGGCTSDKVNFTSDDVYAYCFEPPMGVMISLDEARGDLYHGIHNFVNYNDPVPLVAPYEWGFVRYGTDHYYPDRLNDIFFDYSEREKIVSLYHFTYGAQKFSHYSVDEWKFFDVGEKVASDNNLPRKSVNPSQGRFSHAFIHELATNGFRDRETYVEKIQDGVRELLATAFGLNKEIGKVSGSGMIDIIFEYDFIKNLFLELMNCESAQFAMDMQMLFLQIFGANENNFEQIRALYEHCFTMFYLLPESFVVRKDILAQLLYRDNMLGIVIAHMPEVSYSFLSACDTRFMGDKACKFNDGSYRTLHIQDPKSFTLFEKQIKKTVFSYINGEMSSDYLAAEQYADGSIDIYLPTNGKYEYLTECDSLKLGFVDPLLGETITNEALPLSGTIE